MESDIMMHNSVEDTSTRELDHEALDAVSGGKSGFAGAFWGTIFGGPLVGTLIGHAIGFASDEPGPDAA